MQPIVTDVVGLSVCVCLSVSVTTSSRAKMDESIEMHAVWLSIYRVSGEPFIEWGSGPCAKRDTLGHTWSYLGMPTVDILNAIGKEQRIAMHLHGYTLPLM